MAASDPGLGMTWNPSSVIAPELHFLISDTVTKTVHDARNNNAKILSLIPSQKTAVGSRNVIERVQYGRDPRAFGAVGEGGRFPDPGQHKMRIYAYRTRTQFARFIMDGFLLRAAENDPNLQIDLMTRKIEQFTDDHLVDLGRVMWSDGSGRLCEIAEQGTTDLAITTAQQFTMRVNQDIATGYGSPGATVAGASDMPPTFYLQPGMRVLIVSAAGVAKAVCLVQSVDDANQATLLGQTAVVAGTTWFGAGGVGTGNVGVVVGDWVVKTNTNTANSTTFITNAQALADSAFKHEPMGLMGILGYLGVLDGHGPAAEVGATVPTLIEGQAPVTHAAYQWGGTDNPAETGLYYFQGLAANSALTAAQGWDSELTFNQGVLTNGGGNKRPPSEVLFMRDLDTLMERNSALPEVFVSDYSIFTTYAATLAADKRYNDTLVLKGGWDRNLVGPSGIPWVRDRQAWKNTVVGLSLQTGGFNQWVTEELRWANYRDAPTWHRVPGDTDVWAAEMVEARNIGVGVRDRAGIRMLEISET